MSCTLKSTDGGDTRRLSVSGIDVLYAMLRHMLEAGTLRDPVRELSNSPEEKRP